MRRRAEHDILCDHMAIARVARWLWVHAGTPAGQYGIFWAKAERAILAAQQPQQLEDESAAAAAETGRLGCAPENHPAGPGIPLTQNQNFMAAPPCHTKQPAIQSQADECQHKPVNRMRTGGLNSTND